MHTGDVCYARNDTAARAQMRLFGPALIGYQSVNAISADLLHEPSTAGPTHRL
jgi:hypothetical protein